MTTKVLLKNARFVSNTFPDGTQQYIGFVRGDSFINTDIPSDKTNPRQFMGIRNKNYKDMAQTLKTEPELFSRKNSAGITVFATALENNGDGSYTLILDKDDGIANGGHTYNALKRHGTDRSYVKFVVEIGIDRSDVVEITKALNNHKKVATWGAHNLNKRYNWHKEALGHKYREVAYHEGDEGKLGVMEAMAYLHLFHRSHTTGEFDVLFNIKKSEENAGTLINQIAKDTPYAKHFISSLKWIAKDVHNVTIDLIFNEKIITILKGHETSTGKKFIATRNGAKGVPKNIAILTIGGLANVGSEVNKNGVVVWKKGFETHEDRLTFVVRLMDAVMSYMMFREGTTYQVCREEYTRKQVLTASEAIAKSFLKEQKKTKKNTKREKVAEGA